MVGFCISDDEVCCKASKDEIIRRYYTATNKLADGTTFNELALTQSPTEVDAPSGITAATAYSHEPAQVFTTDGRLVAQTTADAIMQLPLRRGIYVVKTASRAWRIAR